MARYSLGEKDVGSSAYANAALATIRNANTNILPVDTSCIFLPYCADSTHMTVREPTVHICTYARKFEKG